MNRHEPDIDPPQPDDESLESIEHYEDELEARGLIDPLKEHEGSN